MRRCWRSGRDDSRLFQRIARQQLDRIERRTARLLLPEESGFCAGKTVWEIIWKNIGKSIEKSISKTVFI